MQIALLGLGNMGLNLAQNMKQHGHDVVGWNRSEQRRISAREQGIEVADSISEAISKLAESPKVVWLMVAAGEAVDSVCFDPGAVFETLTEGDIVIDGANSHYKDSQKRAARFAARGIRLLDCGVSGGLAGALDGACMMLGGGEAAFKHIEPLIRDITTEQGYGYFGSSGAGHYVKMVHNAIEYGMMQAIAEGLNLMKLSQFPVDMTKLTEVWNNGSIISGNLMRFLNQAFKADPELSKHKAEIGSLGTANWAVTEALEKEAPFTNIANAVFTRFESHAKDSFEHEVVQAMRAVFGGHDSDERML
jgi:6-phosphogluconate dehydrogenase